jgi:hypothetical protein
MILREFIYFDNKHADPQEDDRYIAQHDTSVLRDNELRKVRLTFAMLNDLRKASEAHEKESQEERGLIRQMYATPPPEQAAAM